MEQENINALDEIHKGACMGTDAIHFILDKVEDESLKEFLNKQYNDYQEICTSIETVYPKYNEGKPHETGIMNKTMTWYQIETKTFNEKSTSKIAEILLQGTNMGIIEGRKILNKKNINQEVESIVSNYVTMQEKCVETLKEYL